MEQPQEVWIVSSHPGTARTLAQDLEEGPRPVRCQIINHPPAPDAAGPEPQVLVLAPRAWEEMNRWLPALQARFAATPWLLVADLRVAGLFLSFLPSPPRCTILRSPAAPDELREAFESLVSGAPRCTPDDLRTRINRALTLPDGSPAPSLTPRELQLGCACTFGLTNHEIAQTLGLSEGTVKNEMGPAFRKLKVETRRQLASAITRAVFHEPGSD